MRNPKATSGVSSISAGNYRNTILNDAVSRRDSGAEQVRDRVEERVRVRADKERSRADPKPAPLLLTIPEAAVMAGLTVWQMRGLIARKELPVVPVGRAFYIRRAALLRWVERAEGMVD